jgi:pSer/pThr/pTyr-binding forkhead associated (FHA) protein
MLLLRVTDSRGAVTPHIAESFPYTVGRSPQADLRLQEPGIFENHATILPAGDGRFLIQAEGESLLLRNGEPVRSAPLAAGDELLIGSLRVVVSLAPARQKSLGLSEAAAWVLLAAVVAGELLVLSLAR